MVIGAILGTICAVSGYLIAAQIPQFGHLWWAGWVGGAAGLGVAFVTMALEQAIKRIPLKTILGSTLGLFVGLGIGKLASYPFDKYLELPNLQIPLIYFLFSHLWLYRFGVGGQEDVGGQHPLFPGSGQQAGLPRCP